MNKRRKFIQDVSLGAAGIVSLSTFQGCLTPPAYLRSQFTSLPRSTPEAQGISSIAIDTFLQTANESGLEFHSIMLIRNAHVVAEGWWVPFAAEYKHTLYSLSKSFTSTSVGLAIEDGKLGLDDRVIDYFPEATPSSISANLAKMTIKHLLTMNTGHGEKPMSRMQEAEDGNWARVFLSETITHDPGTHFLYNTGASYMLSSIVQKLVGKNIFEYLSERIFQPLNIHDADWEMDPNGVCVGGYGLRVTTEDIANFGQLYLQEGLWNGKQLISKSWVEEATKKQTESQEGDSDWSQGYGYQFWRCKPTLGFYRGDGAFGQFCIVIPQKNTVIAVTSESNNMQASMDLIWEHLLPALEDSVPLPPNEKAVQSLLGTLNGLAIPPLESVISSPIVSQITDKKYILYSNQEGAKSLMLSFTNERCILTMNFDDKSKILNCGFGEWIIEDNNLSSNGSLFVIPKNGDLNSKVAACVAWESDDVLQIKLKFIEGIHSDLLTCTFENDNITINFRNSVTMLQNRTDSRVPWKGTLNIENGLK